MVGRARHKRAQQMDVQVHAHHPKIWKSEAGGLPLVWGQTGICSKTMSHKTKWNGPEIPCYNMGEPHTESASKGLMLYNFLYVKYLEEEQSLRQRLDHWLAGVGGGAGEWGRDSMIFFLRWPNFFWSQMVQSMTLLPWTHLFGLRWSLGTGTGLFIHLFAKSELEGLQVSKASLGNLAKCLKIENKQKYDHGC